VQDHEYADDLILVAERQGIDVQRYVINADEFAVAGVKACGAGCGSGFGAEFRRETGCSRKNGAARAIDSDAFQVFPLFEAFDEPLNAAVRFSINQGFDQVLKGVAEDLRPVRQIAAEDALLGMNLIGGKQQTAGGYADDKREHQFQSSAHRPLKLTIPRFRKFANKSLQETQQLAEHLSSALGGADSDPAFCLQLAAA
jgi:hypothetical protein